MAEVGRRCGVSPMTVSYCYNQPDRVAPDTLRRVREVAAELGYQGPDPTARSLRRRHNGAIGVVLEVLSFCGYLAWLGGPGPYIGGLIAILDLGVMFGMFFGLRPERLPEARLERRDRAR